MNTAHLWFALLIGACAAAATAIGGTLAIRFRSAQLLLSSFSSGAVIGVALLDLLPEALSLSGAPSTMPSVTTATACGFAAYFFLDRSSQILFDGQDARGRHLGPASLSMHSLLDGLGIGLAFQVSSGAGVIVTIAVLAHDFVDGANTVTLSFEGGGGVATARRWLAADALAPLCGILVASLLTVPPALLALLLAVFAGGFLYIGASKLLPRSRNGEGGFASIWATGLGLAFIFIVVRLAKL